MSFTNCLIHNPRQLPDANIYSIINCERHSENVDSVPTVVLNQDSLHSSYSSLIFFIYFLQFENASWSTTESYVRKQNHLENWTEIQS